MDNLRQKTVEIRVKNKLSELNYLSEKLNLFVRENGLNNADCHDINLALEEWFANLVRHGYKDAKESEIIIAVELQDTVLKITITDEGKPFNPLKYRLPVLNKPLAERVPGGIGLHIILNLMDKVSYKRENNKNILRLEKNRTDRWLTLK